MVEQKTLSSGALANILLLALIWGGSFLSIRLALNEIPALTTVLHRTFWASVVLWLWLWRRRAALPRDVRIWAACAVMGLLNNVLPFSLMAYGQLYVETGLTAILNATTAIFGVLVAAAVFPDERLSPAKCIGVGVGFLGVALCIGPQNLASFDPGSVAQIAILLGAFSYALAGAWARRALGGLKPDVAAACMLTCATMVMAPAALAIDGLPQVRLSWPTIAAIGYYALIATAGAYLLYFRIVAAAGAGNLLIVTLVIPPVAILLGALVLNESLPFRAFAGFGLLALGLLILSGALPRLAKIDPHRRRG